MDTIKLSKNTLALLNNFSDINQGIVISPGNVLSTMNTANSVFAQAKIEENFPKKFGIYCIKDFLKTLALFSEPEITFGDNALTIKEGRAKAKYVYAGKNIVAEADLSDIAELPQPELEFTLPEDDLAILMKSVRVVGANKIEIKYTAGETLEATILNPDTSNNYTLTLPCKEAKQPVKTIIDIPDLNLIDCDYEVQIMHGGTVCKFTSKIVDLFYLVCANNESE